MSRRTCSAPLLTLVPELDHKSQEATRRAVEQVAVVLADIAAAVVRKEKARDHQSRGKSV